MTVRTSYLLGGAAVLSAGAIALTLYLQWPPATAPLPSADPVTSTDKPAPVTAAVNEPAPVAVAQHNPPLVPTRAGTDVDGRLQTDGKGNLVVDSAVRDYIDYYLRAADEVGLEKAVNALIDDAHGRLREPALGQFSRLLGDYLDYKRASLALTEQPLSAQLQLDPQAQVQALQDASQRMAALRREYMSEAAVEAFFAKEEAYSRYTLGSLALEQREDLSDSAKAVAMEELHAQLPAAIRASEARQAHEQVLQAEIERLQQQEASEEEMRSFLSKNYDAATVDRLIDEQRSEQSWQQHYAGYRQELLSLAASGLDTEDLRAETARLRERLFTEEEMYRVEAFDALAARKEASASVGR
ncbi:lipase chaperone [Pseudomonas sp. LS44]|uniref:lipase secretion chaperone n=1 Tax=Pseudomonas sp. LS44 TaxID=1357074 RepID=UPI00215B4604|nr:lipase secretion chaperone [Pseudomonas sp. LS44]UVE16526.1 lipase chaperone [Pseudomonas sp. LS44]